MPAAASASRTASATAALAAWCRPRRPIRVSPRRGRATVIPSRSQPVRGAGSTSVRGTPSRWAPSADDLQRVAGRPGHGQVAALDDRGLLPGDRGDRRPETVGVVEVHVGDRGHAAVPGMGRVEATAQPDLDQGQIDPHLGEPAEGDRGQELELGRLARLRRPTRSAASRPRRRAGRRWPGRPAGRRPGAASR